MKKTLLIILLTAFAINVNADRRGSELNLRLHDKGLFTATLDRESYIVPSGKMTFTDLAPGRHHLTVAKVWGPRNKHQNIVFSGIIEVPSFSRVNAIINRYNNFRIRKITALAPPIAPVHCAPVYNPYQNHVPAPCAIGALEFDILVSELECSYSDNRKLYIVRHVMERNYFTTAQVVILMRAMTFESSKLAVAKEAYHKTVDNHIYYTLFDEFTFQSSIRYLSEYMSMG